jgi:hypothetical protein
LETIRAQIVNTRVYFSDLLIAPIHLLASYSSAAAVSVAAGTKASIRRENSAAAVSQARWKSTMVVRSW